ncbi:MAG TPA: DUF58 domain-containing protein [Cyclobacteriaceae bacterium]|nr:DUF58 domain-containing protein [Cyclobacteriaceae bacterium]
MKLDPQKLREIGKLDLIARQLVEGFITGLHKSPYHGFSVEFAEHRLYNSGESTKNIDWKVFARTDRLYTKRYEEETNLRCQLLIDNSSSMYYPAPGYGKISFSIMAAAALAYLLHNQRDAIGLCTFSEKIELQTSVKSTSAHLHKIFLYLETLMDGKPVLKKSSVADVLHQIANKIHKRSLIIIFSDMFDNQDNVRELFNSLHHLKHNQHEVILFHVTDKNTENRFMFDDRPYEFIDLETNEKLKVQASEIRDKYVMAVNQYYHDLKMKCGQYKIDFVEVDIQEDFDKVLLSYLIKRTRMMA